LTQPIAFERDHPSPDFEHDLTNHDNIYLRGGANIADALRQGSKNNGGESIAMRMKRNREAALNCNAI